jgi:predicted transposase/invertase (TIGR01784 family)
MEVPGFFPQRALYYWAKFHQQQMQEGDDYRNLRPTVSVCFVNRSLFPQLPGYHHTFRLLDGTQRQALTDDLAIHVPELPRLALTAEELASPLDVWCYFLRHGESLDSDCLPPPLDIPPIHQALEVLRVLTQSDRERERYEARRKFQRDQYTLLAEARDQGLEQGRAQGELIGRIHAYQRLGKRPLTPREELLAAPLPELARLAEELERQLPGAS